MPNNYCTNKRQVELNLQKQLDKGIDDMENGRELSMKKAFQKIDELRNTRRRARA